MNIKDFKTLDQLNPLMGVISDNDLMLIKPANKTDAYKETFANVKNKILANVPTDLGGFTNNAGYLKADDIANKADKATSLAGYGINDAYTKTQVDSKVEDLNDKITAIGSPLKWIASATPATIAALTPQTGLKEGHVYTVSQDGSIGNLAVKEGDEVAWNGIEWFIVGHTKVVPVTPDWSAASGQPGYIANKPTNVAESGITDVYTKTEVNTELGNKSNTGHTHNVSDITDFPQSDWNQSNTEAKDYIKNKPDLKIEADGSKTDRKKVTLGSSQQSFLTDHQKIPAQVQSDWNESDTDAAGFIQNKPSIPAAQIQSDWNQTNSGALDFIKNKPSIPSEQIQSDWNQSDNTAKDYIKNKPTVPTIDVDGESDPLTALKLKAGKNISITVDSNGWTVISYDGY